MRRFLAAMATAVAGLTITGTLIWSKAIRQFKYGDTWVRVHLITGKTEVLVGNNPMGVPSGWRTFTGTQLPPPDIGRGASPASAP